MGARRIESCPTCGQLTNTYRRKINAGMAAALIALYRKAPNGEWVKWPELIKAARWMPPSAYGGDPAKLQLWDFVEQMDAERKDGSKRNGYWRLTPNGVKFVLGLRLAPEHILVKLNEIVGYEGEQVLIQHCIGAAFDYREAMNGDYD